MISFASDDAVDRLCAQRYVTLDGAAKCVVEVALPVGSAGPRGWSRAVLAPKDEAAARELFATLPPKLQLFFLSPLGEFDAVGFAFAVARLSPEAKAFVTSASGGAAGAH